VALSISGILLIAFTENNQDKSTVAAKMVGVALTSVSSGGGELSFLGLTYFYGYLSLAAWVSGSGASGLIGSGAYVAATI
jgi:battenin